VSLSAPRNESPCSRAQRRLLGLAAQAFALLGTLIGVFTIAVGVGPRTTPNIAYHLAMLVVLAWGLADAARTPATSGLAHRGLP